MAWLKHGTLAAFVMLIAMAVRLQPAFAQACAEETFEETRYIVCTVDPDNADLRLFWKNAAGEPYRTFANLADAVRQEGRVLAFAMNAGMYQTDFSPLGLYVENGRELRPADTTAAEVSAGPVPNFRKKPNGVFFLGEKGAGIVATHEFLKLQPKVYLATQSGPMLVIRNRLIPIFIVNSQDRTRRSGVGVCRDKMIRFAISEDAVNFHDFGRLFRDHLKCADALFLDGGGGAGIYYPAMERNDISWHGGYGPMFGLVE